MGDGNSTWEFANENFKRGQRDLLIEIRRRKTVPSSQAKPVGDGGPAPSPSISGDDLGSSSTSSPDSKHPGSVDTQTVEKLENLSDENERFLLSISQEMRDLEPFSTRLYESVKRDIGLLAGCKG